jgi:hypothetical protein
MPLEKLVLFSLLALKTFPAFETTTPVEAVTSTRHTRTRCMRSASCHVPSTTSHVPSTAPYVPSTSPHSVRFHSLYRNRQNCGKGCRRQPAKNI